MGTLISKNPATGEPLRELTTTSVEDLPRVFARAREAQARWAALSVKRRTAHLLAIREALLNDVDAITTLISAENGKPRFEALANEVFPVVDMLTFFSRCAPRALRDRDIKLKLMRHRRSTINYWPLGVVTVISPWNYPFLLPFGEIMMALVAGNAVVFKPSEVTPLIGLKIQELCEKGGLPEGLLQTVVGDGSVGAAIIQQKPAKIFFTGSVATGKRIMAAAAEHLIPVNLELGGKDPMIVLPDADLDHASSAALWGGYTNSGQMCSSVERILVHEEVADLFLVKLREKLAQLRQAPFEGEGRDLGVITFEKQKATYEAHLREAREKGARFFTGGEFSADRTALAPTIVTGPGVESLDVYNEETFGPVVAVTTFRSVDEAVRKANRSRYGLVASVMTRDLALGDQVARRLEAGTVTVNEVCYTAGIGETPWGGVKDSGFGRSHSEEGLLEFVNVRHIHRPRSRLFVFKSPWWFPYTPFQYAMIRQLLELYRRSRLDRLRAFPHLLWNALKFWKSEPRL